jgi:hypothetical protein
MIRERECGAGKVKYDDATCVFTCTCTITSCKWEVICGSNPTISGTNPPRIRDPRPGMKVDGRRDLIAKYLGELWGLPVSVATGASPKDRVNKAATGTRDDIARAFGLELG